MTQIAEGLAARGHRLHIITSLPWYRDHAIEPGWGGRIVRHEEMPWGRITRVHPFPTDKTNIPARALGFVGFTALGTLQSLIDRSKPDAVLAMSPPIFLGAAGWLAAKRHRVPFVFNIQDVFPDAAVETGAISNPKVIAAAASLERQLYLHADAVTVLSEDLRDNVVAKIRGRGKGGDPAKVRVIPNFIDTDRITPGPADNEYRSEFGLRDKTVVMYAGNVGFSQSLDLMLAAARAFTDRPDVAFVINGGGSARADLERDATGLTNLHFVDMQPRERLAEVAAAGDIHVVALRTGLARSSVPSKLYTILAAGRPVVASVDPGTEVARTVEQAGAGLAVAPDDPAAFVEAVTQLVDAGEGRVAMGAAGRSFVEGWASPAAVAETYDALFEELIAARARR
jgi:colanic acid biosynthesis glycosyl transferase WcaI